jgi:LysR family transcriptional regulator, cell division regulator
VDVADLKIFTAVARHGGMNRAADELHMVQSNVTTRIRALETEIGCPLFDRHSRGVALTTAGRRLLPHAEKIIQQLVDATRATRDDGEPAGTLTVGSLETTIAVRLSPVLSSFVAAHPKVDLLLRTGTSCELIEQVLDRQIEGAFVCGPVKNEELETQAVFEEELVLLAAPTVRSLQSALDGSNPRIVVLRAGCSYRQRLENLLIKRGFPAPRLLEFGTLEAIAHSVSAGLGLTLLPRSVIENVWRDDLVSVHSLPRHESVVTTQFVRRRDAYVSSALAAFLEAARSSDRRVRSAAKGRSTLKLSRAC